MRRITPTILLVAVLGTIACGGSTASSNTEHGTPGATAAAEGPAPGAQTAPGKAVQLSPGAVPLDHVTLADGVVVGGGDCPDPGPGAAAEIAAQASARIPLVVGLTLTHIWKFSGGERECLTQVTSVDARAVSISMDCGTATSAEIRHFTRHLCVSDLRDAAIYVPQFGSRLPVTLTGTTAFTVGTRAFAALKSTGELRHRYVEVGYRKGPPTSLFGEMDLAGTLKRKDTSVRVPWALDLFDTQEVLVNDRPVKLPVIHAWGQVRGDSQDDIRMMVLDDAAFPVVLNYEQVGKHFSIRYTKVSYPTSGSIEKALEEEKHVDVYGIYFDFASDRLRPESEPVLHEMAEALRRNPAWSLDINGHTDNVGGDVFNLDLSKRRSQAVRKALVGEYAIDAARLATNGFGATQPKESNDTAEGRARNRRVELVRH